MAPDPTTQGPGITKPGAAKQTPHLIVGGKSQDCLRPAAQFCTTTLAPETAAPRPQEDVNAIQAVRSELALGGLTAPSHGEIPCMRIEDHTSLCCHADHPTPLVDVPLLTDTTVAALGDLSIPSAPQRRTPLYVQLWPSY
eukprot:CAMPEP_0204309772 /NCGR_PEP_ID=MMETSP0469-20131031/1304_1 /ASSEMBLY_ACC=CAM_ASM_000384 /TAXON_ID=2969 /ORGANISM="Oxyrrhis marina" /LENGTH=139 /DNA_ID=CAMNT_0051289443 /DNA_START=20 /DNA_END=439 /DNA_ORIENTATION=-